jgi:deazaflavin-dependent oxidoreductase (nitroreductase family)
VPANEHDVAAGQQDERAGGMTMAEDDFCYLTTVGRSSGRPHRIEIWYARRGPTVYLLAGGRDDADWVRNLRRTPRAELRFGSDPTAHVVSGRVLDEDQPEADLARQLVFEKYDSRYGGDLRDWRSNALPVALDLEEPDEV